MTKDDSGSPTQAFNQSVEAFNQFVAGIKINSDVLKGLIQACQQVGSSMMQLHALLWQMYLDAGAMYGETDEGFTQWLNDLRTFAAAERMKAEVEQRQQQALANVKSNRHHRD